MSSSAASLANLLGQMYQDQEVLQGWDAVMNLLESSVNSFLLDQWDHHTASAGKMTISLIWCEGVQPFHGDYFTNVTQFDVELGPPNFQFKHGTDSVTVRQDILGGTLKTGTVTVNNSFNPAACGCAADDPKVTWGQSVSINTAAKPFLSGVVALAKVQGQVNASANSLVLDFAKGDFTLNQLTVTGVTDAAIVAQLKNWFASHKITYILASLDFQDLANHPALTPTSFMFDVLTTDAGNTIVQLLITTNGTQPQARPIVDEPIPTADGLTCSLMISSRILYEDILAAGFNQSGTAFRLQAVPPQSTGKAWYATITPALQFSGGFSFGSCCDRTTVYFVVELSVDYSGSETTGFTLTQHQSSHGDAPIEISISAHYPVALSGSGARQEFKITPGTPTVTVTGSAEGEIRSRLEGILNNDLRRAMAGVSISPVTFFALKNLLFPGNLIKMNQAQVPGDLLIVGTFAPA